jgi:hypothetical protein
MIFSRIQFATLLIATAAACMPAAAQLAPRTGAVVTTPHVRAELIAHAPDGVAPGAPVWVGLQITHQPEWHTYWKNAGDSGLPTEMTWTLPAGVSTGEIAWPVPKKIPVGNLANYGYENTVLLPVPLEVSTLYKPPVALGRHASDGHPAQGLLAGLPQGVHSRRRRVHAVAAAARLDRAAQGRVRRRAGGTAAAAGPARRHRGRRRQPEGAPRRPARRRAGQDAGLLPRDLRGDPHRGRFRQGLDPIVARRHLDRDHAAGRPAQRQPDGDAGGGGAGRSRPAGRPAEHGAPNRPSRAVGPRRRSAPRCRPRFRRRSPPTRPRQQPPLRHRPPT